MPLLQKCLNPFEYLTFRVDLEFMKLSASTAVSLEKNTFNLLLGHKGGGGGLRVLKGEPPVYCRSTKEN